VQVFKFELVRRPVVSEIGDAESFVVDLLSHCFGALVHRQLSDCFTLKTGVLPRFEPYALARFIKDVVGTLGGFSGRVYYEGFVVLKSD